MESAPRKPDKMSNGRHVTGSGAPQPAAPERLPDLARQATTQEARSTHKRSISTFQAPSKRSAGRKRKRKSLNLLRRIVSARCEM